MIDTKQNRFFRSPLLLVIIGVAVAYYGNGVGVQSFSVVKVGVGGHCNNNRLSTPTRFTLGVGLIRTINYKQPANVKAPTVLSLWSNTNQHHLGASQTSMKLKGKRKRNCVERGRLLRFSSSSPSMLDEDGDEDEDRRKSHHRRRNRLETWASTFTLFTPLWTILAAVLAVWKASWCSTALGSLRVMQKAYATLMFVMGLTIAPEDLKRALRYPSVLGINAGLCFCGMPLLASAIAKLLHYSPSQAIGLVLLGSVSGGQASNLFALIAGGDTALSVICTISTTLLGVVATPFLIQLLLGCSVSVSGRGVLESIVSLVLVPLLGGSALATIFPKVLRSVSPLLPTIGVLSTLVLVAGGSSNSMASLGLGSISASASASASTIATTLLPSVLLAGLGGAMALCVAQFKFLNMNERTKRTLVVETLSKSPTLAYILALKHFDVSVATVPGAAMVTLAVLGALVASFWSMVDANADENADATVE